MWFPVEWLVAIDQSAEGTQSSNFNAIRFATHKNAHHVAID